MNKRPHTSLVCCVRRSSLCLSRPKSMNTKLSQIEKSLKLKYRLDNEGEHGGHGRGGPARAQAAGGDGGGFGHPRNREYEQLTEELHRYNGVLLRENSDLKTKIKVEQKMERSVAIQSYDTPFMRCRNNAPVRRATLAQENRDLTKYRIRGCTSYTKPYSISLFSILRPVKPKHSIRPFQSHPSPDTCRCSTSTIALHAAAT